MTTHFESIAKTTSNLITINDFIQFRIFSKTSQKPLENTSVDLNFFRKNTMILNKAFWLKFLSLRGLTLYSLADASRTNVGVNTAGCPRLCHNQFSFTLIPTWILASEKTRKNRGENGRTREIKEENSMMCFMRIEYVRDVLYILSIYSWALIQYINDINTLSIYICLQKGP